MLRDTITLLRILVLLEPNALLLANKLMRFSISGRAIFAVRFVSLARHDTSNREIVA